jgi:hypothetical protein
MILGFGLGTSFERGAGLIGMPRHTECEYKGNNPESIWLLHGHFSGTLFALDEVAARSVLAVRVRPRNTLRSHEQLRQTALPLLKESGIFNTDSWA